MDYVINHEIRIPSLNNQDSIESNFFLSWLTYVFVREMTGSEPTDFDSKRLESPAGQKNDITHRSVFFSLFKK